MSRKVKIRILKYGVTFLCVAAAAGGILLSKDAFNLPLLDQYRVLSDAFTLPGLLLVLFWALVALSNEGALDGLTYVVTRLIRVLIPGAAITQERYGDYVARKREKPVKGYGFLLISGIVTLVISYVFLFLFLSMYNA